MDVVVWLAVNVQLLLWWRCTPTHQNFGKYRGWIEYLGRETTALWRNTFSFILCQLCWQTDCFCLSPIPHSRGYEVFIFTVFKSIFCLFVVNSIIIITIFSISPASPIPHLVVEAEAEEWQPGLSVGLRLAELGSLFPLGQLVFAILR